jgi:RHS repeat-associated protein
MILAAMEAASSVFPLAAIRASGAGAELARNSHQGLASSATTLRPAPTIANSNTASGLRVCLYDSGRRSRSTGKERDADTGLDYFGARYFSAAQGRFTSPDPINANILRVINPQRWNMYAYAVNNPLAYTDPDGRDAIAVNFQKQVPVGGHEGIISVHRDGRAQYASFGPRGGGRPFGEGEVKQQALSTVQFGGNGLPTDASYTELVQQVAKIEGQDPSTVRMNYFKTSETETMALDAWIQRNKAASDRRQAASYDVTRQNCATFCIAGLIQGNAIENKGLSLTPNILFELLSLRSVENYSQGQRSPKEKVTSKICFVDENGKQVCQ